MQEALNMIWMNYDLFHIWEPARELMPGASWPSMRNHIIFLIKRTPYDIRKHIRKDIKAFLQEYGKMDGLELKAEAFAMKDLLRRSYRYIGTLRRW
jgi:hypothetical protein